MSDLHEYIRKRFNEIYNLQRVVNIDIHVLGYNKLEKENVISKVSTALTMISVLNRQMEELLNLFKDQLEDDK